MISGYKIPDDFPDNVKLNARLGVDPYWVTQTNENSLKLNLSSTNGEITETDLKIEQLRPITESRSKATHALTYLSFDENKNRITNVHFNVHGKIEERKGSIPQISYMRVTVKITELARALNVSEQFIKDAVEAETLDKLITDRLSANFLKPKIPEKSSLSGKPSDESSGELPFQPRDPVKTAPSDLSVVLEVEETSEKELEAPNCILPAWTTGLTKDEYAQIKNFYEANIKALSSLKEPIHIRKGGDLDRFGQKKSHFLGQGELPASLVFIPEGPQKGLHVLLKTHTGFKELGVGAYNLVTYALHMDSGAKKAYRDGLEQHTPLAEQEANKELSRYPQYFVAGTAIHYIGNVTDREFMEIGESKDGLLWERDARKVGFLSDLMETDLFNMLFETPEAKKSLGIIGSDLSKPLTKAERLRTALSYAKSIQALTHQGFVHFDQKPSNVLVNQKGEAKSCDFGYTVREGIRVNCCGTPGYIAPEVIASARHGDGKIEAHRSIDIWSLGCVLADIFESELVPKYLEENYNKGLRAFEHKNFERLGGAKDVYLPYRNKRGHPHQLVSDCLTVEPGNRPSIDEVVDRLEAMVKGIK
jgi:Protein kinase domain